eukprot:GHUV01005657.1.p1 GENE.GHUV01005657.1~~GHUV01005657.1.p1  ORF type:complete len:450 (+),score=58.99 GHUV01005657.1:486-1835(+)
MAYSLGIRCLAEFIGMAIVIYTGEAALANELLPSTKGHAMGWGWTVFTFGFAFFAPLQIFSKVSAKLSPAMCLAQWVWGNITGVDFICLSLAEFAGAFVGAVLHWIHFLPHYKTLPEPPSMDKDDALLRRRDTMRESALQIASYATRPDRKVTRNPISPLKHTFYYLRPSDVIHEETPEEVLAEYYHTTDPLHRRASVTSDKHRPGGGSVSSDDRVHVRPLARKTIQVADLQRHLEAAHVEKVLLQRTCPGCQSGNFSTSNGANDASAHEAGHLSGDHADQLQQPQPDDHEAVVDIGPAPSSPRLLRLASRFDTNTIDKEKQRAHALYQAAVVADQNAKLSIFATRPAIYSPLFNFITETMGTVALILLALLIELQARRFPEGSDIKLFYEVGVQALLISFVIVTCIAGIAYGKLPASWIVRRIWWHAGASNYCWACATITVPVRYIRA